MDNSDFLLEELNNSIQKYQNTLVLSNFLRNNSNFQQDLLSHLFKKYLPYVGHPNANIRVITTSFLNHWVSFISTFSPFELLFALNAIDKSTISSESSGYIFSYYIILLPFIQHKNRQQYVKKLFLLLKPSNPDYLSIISPKYWKLFVKNLDEDDYVEALDYFCKTKLMDVLAIFLNKHYSFPHLQSVLNQLSLLQIRQAFYKTQHRILAFIENRILDALSLQNTDDLSTSLEILHLSVSKETISPSIIKRLFELFHLLGSHPALQSSLIELLNKLSFYYYSF